MSILISLAQFGFAVVIVANVANNKCRKSAIGIPGDQYFGECGTTKEGSVNRSHSAFQGTVLGKKFINVHNLIFTLLFVLDANLMILFYASSEYLYRTLKDGLKKPLAFY